MIVHIIDDDQAVARTMARMVKQGGWDSAIYARATEFLDQVETLPPGCVVSDVRMPEMSGIELIQILHRERPEWPVIMITGFAEVDAAVSSFRHGAVHFLQKPFKRQDLVSALQEAGRIGERRQVDSSRQRQTAGIAKLTKRETEILTALADGLQSKSIAWQFGISTRTVEMHRSNILAKLGAKNTSQAVGLLQLASAA